MVSWNPDKVDVKMVSKDSQHILVHVKMLVHSKLDFFLSAMYGKCTPVDRRGLWSSLSEAVSKVEGYPWIIGGDFNIVRNITKSVGGGVRDAMGMKEFNDCIMRNSIMELPHTGCAFSWSRNWEENGMVWMLDRVLCNMEWLHQAVGCRVNVPIAQEFDHCPLDVSLHYDVPSDPKPFKYHHFLSFHESFQNIVAGVWGEEVDGHEFHKLQHYFKKVRSKLKELNKVAFSNISVRVVEM
ncbi:hypothetical protein LIER_35423 [Lithospermum erythrorhizon]|uniref:Uncharacterized protein n=1 Tax=Lithospermum erythrorhizon TaxID=34254 RepID=A0AAV3NRP8_LITER